MITEPRTVTRRRFLARAGIVAASGLAVAGGATIAVRGLSGPRDPADIVADVVPDDLPSEVAVSVLATVDGQERYRSDAARAGTVHDIASVTKQFTAAAIMKLDVLGEVSTGDRVSVFFPELRAPLADVTLHQLLTHTSGLTDVLGDDYQPLSRADLLRAANDAEPVAPPGQRYSYSNAGYSVLTAVIETVAATSYEEFLAEALFTPAGMTDTGYVLPNWDPERIAVEHDADGTALGRPNERPWADDGPFWNLRGNGGLLSTADDMIAWSAALDGEDVLSRAAVRRMLEPHVAEDESGDSFYGYGWVILDIDGTKVAWHNGSSGAAYSEMLRPVDGGPTVFWATNAAVRSGAWELEESDLAARLAEALI